MGILTCLVPIRPVPTLAALTRQRTNILEKAVYERLVLITPAQLHKKIIAKVQQHCDNARARFMF